MNEAEPIVVKVSPPKTMLATSRSEARRTRSTRTIPKEADCGATGVSSRSGVPGALAINPAATTPPVATTPRRETTCRPHPVWCMGRGQTISTLPDNEHLRLRVIRSN